jgi:hypothetical protein
MVAVVSIPNAELRSLKTDDPYSLRLRLLLTGYDLRFKAAVAAANFLNL